MCLGNCWARFPRMLEKSGCPHFGECKPVANDEHLAILRQGIAIWNEWRARNPEIKPDLSGADLTDAGRYIARVHKIDLRGANLSAADLSEADLTEADLELANLRRANLCQASLSKADLSLANLRNAMLVKADLTKADLARANLRRANLSEADLSWASLSGADVRGADLSGANLSGAHAFRTDFWGANLSGASLSQALLVAANLNGANLQGANLINACLERANLAEADLTDANFAGANMQRASLVATILTKTDFTGCRVYGISAWGLRQDRAKQRDLIITPQGEPEITVDHIEVAQFIYLLLHNEKIRSVIDTITSKVVLILGRFTAERKAVLDALRDELRQRNYLPVVFDFEKPASQTTDETITLLARMARFLIADISDAKSVLQELRGIVPDLPSLAVQPLILIPQEEPGMFDFFRVYPWVLEPYRYQNHEALTANLVERIIRPAEARVLDLRGAPSG
jgi:uncharacterized protein YjbI with pentapeptide repeats